jgi:hypothetical protein
MNIHIHIDRLILDTGAMTPAEQQFVRGDLEVELHRLVTPGNRAGSPSNGLTGRIASSLYQQIQSWLPDVSRDQRGL